MISNKIIAFRATHNLSQEELCDLMDGYVTPATVSKYETGFLTVPPKFQHKFNQLVQEYGVDEKYIKFDKYNKKGQRGIRGAGKAQERPASDHYHTGNIDVWAFADENFSLEEVTGFHRIDAIKYLARYGKKDGYNRKDLEKAIVEIEKLLELHDQHRTEEAE